MLLKAWKMKYDVLNTGDEVIPEIIVKASQYRGWRKTGNDGIIMMIKENLLQGFMKLKVFIIVFLTMVN